MILRFIRNSILFVLLVLLYSCTENPFDIKLEKDIETTIIRFDKELMQVDTANMAQAIDGFYNKYPIFFPTYTYGVLGVGGREQKAFSEELKRFLSNPITQEVNLEIQKKFEDVSDIKASVEKALSYYYHYFPDVQIPDIYFFQSGFNQRIIVDSLVLGIALDMCLGADNDYYKQLALPQYLAKKMNREDIALDAMRAIAWSDYIFEGDNNLASNMIYEGKVQYLMDALFPNSEDAQKLSYSESDMRWLDAHKEDVWNAVIQEEMLYQTDHMKIKNMIENAPFTQSFGNNSPPKVGVWLGWQIVKSYMKENPEVSLQELMRNTDYIGILNESNYRP